MSQDKQGTPQRAPTPNADARGTGKPDFSKMPKRPKKYVRTSAPTAAEVAAARKAEDEAVAAARLALRIRTTTILEQAAERAAVALAEAVSQPIGVVASGGIDSAAVQACRLALQAAGHLKEQVDVTSGGEQVGGFVIPMKKPHG